MERPDPEHDADRETANAAAHSAPAAGAPDSGAPADSAPADDATRASIQHLLQHARGERELADAQVLPMVYDELRRLASRLLRRESKQTIQATELVHEAWMRMLAPGELEGADENELRRRFTRLAAQAMRWVLVDRARERKALKRGGDWQRITFCEEIAGASVDAADIVDIDAALNELESFRARLARLAELRLFGGLSTQEAALTLGISRSLATDEWALARSLLAQSLGQRSRTD